MDRLVRGLVGSLLGNYVQFGWMKSCNGSETERQIGLLWQFFFLFLIR